ncbi:MAG: dTDP-glucose 4,6-dehydratase, partial [Bacteroidales bacterium]|nr:dTDP-glucose 4,6-dehydratase [Bacteroidales bacterium]
MEKTVKKYKKNILVTGGAGFIGSEVVRHFVTKYPDYQIVVFDSLTYAGNLENLKSVENRENYEFFKGDIRLYGDVLDAFDKFGITDVIHLAAESHVDRSIKGPRDFVDTNVVGTFNLLEAAKVKWGKDYSSHRFHHVSTDEVYGSLNLGDNTYFHENTKYDPHSPYSASKAASDHFVKAYHDTYGLNVTISNCSNNYGPYQFPEKLIPLAINNLKNGKKIPIYGKGENIRDWLYVGDHADAIDTIFHKGKNGETYNVGGMCEKSNLEIVHDIIFTYFKTLAFAEAAKKAKNINEFVEMATLEI